MSDKDTRYLSRELESLRETLTDNKPAQIPLLDDVVDDENAQPPPTRRRRSPRPKPEEHSAGPSPESYDLFDANTASADPEARPDGAQAGERPQESIRDTEAYLQRKADQLAQTWVREQADKMVEELVEEYSTEILRRLKARLTSQLYAILADLDTDEKKEDSSDPG